MPDWDAAIAAVKASNQAAAQSLASETSPDDAARAFQLSQATGVPAEHIGSDLAGFEEQHKAALSKSIIENNGYIADFMNRHPLHGPLISDDLGNLDKLSRSYRRLIAADPIENFTRGFKEGYDPKRPFGSYLVETASPEWNALARNNIFATQILTAIGFPIEVSGRMAMGAVSGIHKAAAAIFGDKFANDLAGTVEYELTKPSITPHIFPGKTEFEYPAEGEILPPGAKPPGPALPPKTPEIIEGEAVDLGRRQFLQGVGATAAAAATKTDLPKFLNRPLSGLAEEFAHQALGAGGEGIPTIAPADAIKSLIDTAKMYRDNGPSFLGMVRGYEDAARLIKSGWLPKPNQAHIDMLNSIRQHVEDLRPWLEAGEEPPAGLSQAADAIHEERAKLDQDAIKQALDDANSTALKERAPDKFGEFLDGHPDGTVSISKEAIAKNPTAFDWIPDLERKLQEPLSKIEVSAKDFLTNFDKELWPEFKDDISRGGLTANEAKEIVAYHASPHEFERYDLSKIGTGEGAQSYGHGAYFAENPEVSGEYYTQFLNKRGKAVHYTARIKADPEHFLDWDKPLSEQSENVRKAFAELGHGEGATGEQAYRAFVDKSDASKKQRMAANMAEVQAGRMTTKEANQLNQKIWNEPEQLHVTNQLRAAGIPGIKYLDQRSRAMPIPAKTPAQELAINTWQDDPQKTVRAIRANYKGQTAQDAIKLIEGGWTPEVTPEAPQPTRNYVVFDDKLIDITHKDGTPIKPEDRESLLRQVLGRGRSGRPIRTKPLGDTDRLVEGIRRAAGLDPVGGILEPLIEEPPGGGLPPESPSAPKAPGGPFTEGKAIGATKPEYRKLLDLIRQRDEEDVAWRLKRAEREAERENSAAWKAREAELTPEVRGEVVTRPEIHAWNFFEKGEFLGQKMARRPKLDRAKLTQEQFDALPESWIRDGGLDPDTVAHTFGYQTGGELADALAAVAREAEGTKGDIVDRLTEAEVQRRLEAELGEDARERLDEAQDHALSLTTLEMLHEQTVALATRLGVELPLDKNRMDWGARELLKEQRFGGLSTKKLLEEAGKAARLAARNLTTDDPLEALKNLQYHYTVTQMAKEMSAVEKEAKRFEKDAKRFRNREVKGVGADYTNWIHNILMRVGRTVKRSVQDLETEIGAQPEKTLADFLLSKLGEGYDIGVPDFLVNPSYRKPVEQMTVQEARETFKGIRSLITAGREQETIEIRGEKFDRKEKIKEINEQLKTLGPAKVERTSPLGKLLRNTLSGTLQAEFLFDRMDFGDAWGIVSQWAWRPMAEASNYKAKLGKQIAKALPEIPKSIDLNASVPNTLFRDPHSGLNADGTIDWSRATPVPFTQKNLLKVMHNLGNIDNLQRLAEGYGLEPQQIVDWVNQHATKDHWDYVQTYGNVFKTLKDLSDKMYRRISGVAPKAIELFPIDTPFGRYDGWYHPVIHDPLFPGKFKGSDKALFPKEYVMPSPAAGYTKDRTDYRGPLDLNLDSLPNRINQEIHDIAFREAAIQANKLINDRSFQAHVDAHLGKAYRDTLTSWLKDSVNSSNIASGNQAGWARVSEYFRQNVIGELVGLNIRTVQKHTITAAINSMSEVGPINFLREFRQIALNPTMRNERWALAMDKSEELQRRHQNAMENVTGSQAIAVRPPASDFGGTFDYFRQQALRLGTAPVAFFDLYSAVPTWLARYEELKGRGMSEGDAIYGADTAVRRAHGSSAITSRPELMRNYPWLASLYGFFNHVANQQYRLAWQAKQAAGLITKGEYEAAVKKIPSLAFGVFSYVLAPAIIEELVTPYTNKEKESWGKKAAKTIALGLSSSWIGVRDVARAMISGDDPTIGLAGAGGKALTDLARDITAHEKFGMDRAHAGKTLKHATVALGAMTGLTNAAEGDIAEYLWDLHTGKVSPPKDMKELWRGVSKGTPAPPSDPDLIERMLPGRPYQPSRTR